MFGQLQWDGWLILNRRRVLDSSVFENSPFPEQDLEEWVDPSFGTYDLPQDWKVEFAKGAISVVSPDGNRLDVPESEAAISLDDAKEFFASQASVQTNGNRGATEVRFLGTNPKRLVIPHSYIDQAFIEHHSESSKDQTFIVAGKASVSDVWNCTLIVRDLVVSDSYFEIGNATLHAQTVSCLLYTSPSPRDRQKSRMPSSA